jgi:hypothetical protein
MTVLHAVGAIAALAVLLYLFVALLYPDYFA